MVIINKPAYKFEQIKLTDKPKGLSPSILSSFTQEKGTRTAKEALIVVEGGHCRMTFDGSPAANGHLLPPGFSLLLVGPGNLKEFSAVAVSKSPSSFLSITYFE